MIEGYKTVVEVAEEWGLKPRTIQIMCAEGKIAGAAKFVFFATPKYLKLQNTFPKVAAGNSSFLHVSPA